MQNHTKNKIQKIAIYQTGALGDLLVSTAAVYESIQFYPDAEFTLIGSGLWKEIIKPTIWPNIKFLLEVKNKNFNELRLWRADAQKTSWQEVPLNFKNIIRFLKSYDVTIDLRTESLRFAWRAWLAKVPIRIGGSQGKLAKFFFTHFNLEKSKKQLHERDRYLEILLSLDKNKITERISYWHAQGLPQLIGAPSSEEQKNIILINPTASIREKAWPSEKFRQLAIRLKEQGNEVVIIGSPKETSWLKEISSEDFKTIQPQNILELAKVVAQAKQLITNTSSMQFIAASTKTPTLTLIGFAEAGKWGPLGDWGHFIKGNQSKLNTGLFKPKKETGKLNEVLSYNSISVNDVLSKIN